MNTGDVLGPSVNTHTCTQQLLIVVGWSSGWAGSIHDTSVSGDGSQTRAHKLVLLSGTGPIHSFFHGDNSRPARTVKIVEMVVVEPVVVGFTLEIVWVFLKF